MRLRGSCKLSINPGRAERGSIFYHPPPTTAGIRFRAHLDVSRREKQKSNKVINPTILIQHEQSKPPSPNVLDSRPRSTVPPTSLSTAMTHHLPPPGDQNLTHYSSETKRKIPSTASPSSSSSPAHSNSPPPSSQRKPGMWRHRHRHHRARLRRCVLPTCKGPRGGSCGI